MPLDRTRLLKLLQMTRSANDGEALTAMRMANLLVDRAGEDWAVILGLAAPKEPFPPPRWPEDRPFGGGARTAGFDWESDGEPSIPIGEFLAARIRWKLGQASWATRVLLLPVWVLGHGVAGALEAEGRFRRLALTVLATAGFVLASAIWLGVLALVLDAVFGGVTLGVLPW